MEVINLSNLHLHHSRSDYGHIIVSRYRTDGSKEPIGHIYTEVDGEEIKYAAINIKGREIIPASHQFSDVEKIFERLAHLRSLQEKSKEVYKAPLITNSNSQLNSNLMKPLNQSENTNKRKNHLVYIEHDNEAGDSNIMTIKDFYHNLIGRIHKSYNDQLKKNEYLAFDHAGKLIATRATLFAAKNEFKVNKEVFLEEAHQRRIAKRNNSLNHSTSQHKENDLNESKENQRNQKLHDVRQKHENERGENEIGY